MNIDFTWDRNSLPWVDIVSTIPRSKNKDMVNKAISKMKDQNAAGLPGLVSEMVKARGVDMITELVNTLIVGVIPAELELGTTVYFKKIL